MIKRDHYLNELVIRMHNGLIKVVTGIRRAGKSYLLDTLFYNYLISSGVHKEQIIIIPLDELAYQPLLDAKRLDQYIRAEIKDERMHYLILDEIQAVPDFVPLLNGLRKIKNLDIYVTGSNSRFLSSDILTEFRGRGDQIHVSPLSFKEFYDAQNLSFDEAYLAYLTYGGLPFILKRPTPELKGSYLQNLFAEIYLKDIKERYQLRSDQEIDGLLNVISSSVGSLTSVGKIVNTFQTEKKIAISRNTIYNYLQILEESFLIRKAVRYDIKGRRYINAPAKYYMVDLGLRNARLNFREFEEPHLMENLIYNELIIRGYQVDVGVVPIAEKNEKGNVVRRNTEIDFVANRGHQRIYIQVAYMIPSPEKLAQEIRPFLKVDDSFKKVLIVKDQLRPRQDEYGITTLSLQEFLLNPHILQEI